MPAPVRARQETHGLLCLLLDQHLLHDLGLNQHFDSPSPPPAREQRQRWSSLPHLPGACRWATDFRLAQHSSKRRPAHGLGTCFSAKILSCSSVAPSPLEPRKRRGAKQAKGGKGTSQISADAVGGVVDHKQK
jgi:hypothetical protein